MQNTSKKTYSLVVTALLTAIVIVMAFTPLGYLKVGLIEISFLMLPVAIGAVSCGAGTSMLLGLVFGITSFIQCFGMSALGEFLLAQNPIFCFINCVIARLLAGGAAGLTAKCTKNLGVLGYTLTGLAAAVANTVLFLGAMLLFFWNNDAFIAQLGEWGIPTDSVFSFLAAFAGINCIIEAIVTACVTGAIGLALKKAGLVKKFA